jgi:hypothetical protein
MASAPALAPMNALDGDLLAIGPSKGIQEMIQDINVLQIPSKFAQMSENRQQKHIFATQLTKRRSIPWIQFDFKTKDLKLLKLMPNQRL